MINLNICTFLLLAACAVCLASVFFAVRILRIPQLPGRKKLILAAAHILSFICIAWSITRQLTTNDASVFAAVAALITLGSSGMILTSVRYTFRSLKDFYKEIH